MCFGLAIDEFTLQCYDSFCVTAGDCCDVEDVGEKLLKTAGISDARALGIPFSLARTLGRWRSGDRSPWPKSLAKLS